MKPYGCGSQKSHPYHPMSVHMAPTPASNDISRRSFVHAAGAATLLTAASFERVLGANERVGVGFIGYGLIGKLHLLDFQEQKDVDGVAVAEAHRGRKEEAVA